MATGVSPVIRSLSCVFVSKIFENLENCFHVVKSPWNLFPHFDSIHTTLSWLFKYLFSESFTHNMYLQSVFQYWCFQILLDTVFQVMSRV